MTNTASPPGLPPTLGYFAQRAVGIDAECHDCHHKAALGFELFLARYGDMPFPAFTRLLKFSAWQDRRAAGYGRSVAPERSVAPRSATRFRARLRHQSAAPRRVAA